MSTTWKTIKIKSGNGKFYTSSKEEKEGWTKVENLEHGTRWHNYFSNVEGKLKKISLDEEGNYGDKLKLFVETGEDEVSVIEIGVMSASGHMNSYAVSLVRIIDKLKIGETYTIFPNSKNKDKKGNLYRNLVFLMEDNKAVVSDLTKDDVPDWEQKPNPIKKKELIWDSTAQSAFYYERLDEYLSNGEEKAEQEEVKPQDIKEDKSKAPSTPVSDENLDLPF